MRGQAELLVERGAARVLLKGGHLPEPAESIDVLAGPEGTEWFTGRWVATRNTHGTGCALSSALAALRPRRDSWAAAVRDAKRWLTAALEASDRLGVGHGAGPAHHFHSIWDAGPA
jgi:hydroxymethylpyrimidine/phosphomethylpyrimidine kinase